MPRKVGHNCRQSCRRSAVFGDRRATRQELRALPGLQMLQSRMSVAKREHATLPSRFSFAVQMTYFTSRSSENVSEGNHRFSTSTDLHKNGQIPAKLRWTSEIPWWLMMALQPRSGLSPCPGTLVPHP